MERKIETVTAPMTADAISAIGVIRVSGPETRNIVEKIFKGAPLEHSRASYGGIYDGDERVDEVVVTFFKAPRSYTGEDVAEISCHGNPLIIKRVTELLIKSGARAARNGEFTKRAFINGKLDLSRAEAVIDLIEADSEAEAANAGKQLGGSLWARINGIREELLALTAKIFAYIDYPDDGIEDTSEEEIFTAAESALSSLRELTASYSKGRLLKNGIKTVLSGKPNVGKSTVMNRLSGFERSIVTHQAGTTRDVITESIRVGDFRLLLSDTAGIRQNGDEIEKMGIALAEKEISYADLCLAVFDRSRPLDGEDEALLSILSSSPAKKIALLNKSDLPPVFGKNDFPRDGFSAVLEVGNGSPASLIEDEIIKLFRLQNVENGQIITNLRQYECLVRGEEALSSIIKAKGLPSDLLLSHVEDAISALGEIDGKTVSEEITEQIFSRFCVGK